MTDQMKFTEAEQLLAFHLSRNHSLTTRDIRDEVNKFAQLLESYFQFQSDDFEQLIKSLETQFITTMGVGVSLIDEGIPHDEDWPEKNDIRWDYWDDYQKHLINEGWLPRVVSSMNSVTTKILGLLQYPELGDEWERRGLVIGHVQSGKTANYIGLITKAADAGYKLIIVIAGIHNNLRTQTQQRIDEGFIGRDSKTNELITVSKMRPRRAMPVTVTTTESDFNRGLAKRFGMQLKSLNNTFILVIKKNVSTLSSLYNWLKELNTREELDKISDIPMLLIDDEADSASINTNQPELDPTRTNKEIRNILNLFRKRCYVGYTATPFANIFIDPDDNDKKLGNNLFPEHFIYCLDAPTNYFGSEQVFLDEDPPVEYIEKIDDAEQFIPLLHRRHDSIDELPESLKEAVRLFILSRAIRNVRGQRQSHSSMMINVSRFVDIQRQIKQLIMLYVEHVQNAIRFNYKLSPERAMQDSFISEFYETYCRKYSDLGVEWTEILLELNASASATKVFLVNSKSDEALDYTAYSKDGNSLTAIVIGGLSLSRGLTLEGLTISYIYRNTKMYDTLMQMGRWFGYRDNYKDLCRIYMSDVSRGWYSHIAEATEELRMQVKRMRVLGKKPSDFGLYVRAHPDTLIVTALNKMRHASNKAFHISYDGKLLETHIVPASVPKTERNRDLFKVFYETLQEHQDIQTDRQSIIFANIPWSRVHDFILRFSFHDDLIEMKESLPRFIKEISDLYPTWDVSFHSLIDKEPEPGFMVAAQQRTIGYDPSKNPKRPATESGWYVGNKGRFSGNSMFDVGLSETQKVKAKDLALEAQRTRPIYSDYTNARGKPLLILHLLNLIDESKGSVVDIIPAINVNFPHSREFRTIEYVVGPVWLKQFEQDQFDGVASEDDYDFGF